jgi:exosortase
LRFALLVLLLAIPIPAIIFNEITFPLQILASKLASALLPLFGVPVLREGNVIELPAMKLEVAEACSGIRSLMSLFTLSIFYGYFPGEVLLRRVVLALASIPIAIAANAVRISALGCASSTGIRIRPWASFTSFPAG